MPTRTVGSSLYPNRLLGAQHQYEEGSLVRTTVLGGYATNYEHIDANTTQVLDPGGKVHLLKVLGEGLVQRLLSSGVWELAQYDSWGRCVAKQVFLKQGSSHIWTRRYHFSAEGDLLSLVDSQRGMTAYAYDAAHRLARITFPIGEVQRFEYDAADNLLRQPGLEATVCAGNKLSVANGDSFHYDERDSLYAREGPLGTTRYWHDSRDQLVRVTAPGLEWEAEYDPLGRRTCKRVNGAQWTYYWDTDRLAAEISPEGRLRIFVYAATRAIVPLLFLDYDSVEAPPESGKRYFVFCDWRGSPELVVGEDGQVAWQALLEAYGCARMGRAEALHQPLRFPGHYYDSETRLHYNRFRYYSPELGRYIESDPIGLDGGINLYAYTYNPVTQTDVRGLRKKCETDPKSSEKKNREDNTNKEEPPQDMGAKSKTTKRSKHANKKSGNNDEAAIGQSVHKDKKEKHKDSKKWDDVSTQMKDADGNPIKVPARIDLETGDPVLRKGDKTVIPDAVSYKRGEILDVKPLGTKISKYRQQIIGYIKAYELKTGKLPKKILIERYDRSTGKTVGIEVYDPKIFLPGKSP